MKIQYKQIYESVKNYLVSQDNYNPIDDHLIRTLAELYALLKEHLKKIKVDNVYLNATKSEDKEDYEIPSPGLKQYNQTLTKIESISTKLGITPSERMKIKLKVAGTDEPENDGFDDE